MHKTEVCWVANYIFSVDNLFSVLGVSLDPWLWNTFGSLYRSPDRSCDIDNSTRQGVIEMHSGVRGCVCVCVCVCV